MRKVVDYVSPLGYYKYMTPIYRKFKELDHNTWTNVMTHPSLFRTDEVQNNVLEEIADAIVPVALHPFFHLSGLINHDN